MRLEHLYNLIEISKNPSMSAAANKLHLTPQGLSISIANMEKELGFQLLERTFKGTTLTNDGKKLVAISIVLFDVIKEIQQSHQQPSQQLSGDYSLPLLYGSINYFLVPAFTELNRRFPALKLATASLTAQEIVQAVSSGDAESGLLMQCTYDSQPLSLLPPTLDFHPICTCRLLACIPRALAISECRSLSLAKLSPYTFILHCRENDDQNLYIDILNHAFPHQPPAIIRQAVLPLCESMAITNRYVSLTLQPMASTASLTTFPQMSYIPLKDNVTLTYGLVTRKGQSLSMAGEVICQTIKEALNEAAE